MMRPGLLLVLSVLLIWSAPRTGGPVEFYEVNVWDAWGAHLLTTTTADTCLALDLPKVPFRFDVRGWNTDPLGVPRPGEASVVSGLAIQPEWVALFWDMGIRAGRRGLTMTTAGVGALADRWQEPPQPQEQ